MLVFSLILDFCDSKGSCKPSFSDALQSLVEATPTKGQALSEKKCMNYHILSEKNFDCSSLVYIGPLYGSYI